MKTGTNSGATSTPYETGTATGMEGESGAVDNRLSLNPNDPAWPAVKTWKDGATYTFKNVEVKQISPGEFEVISAETGEDENSDVEDQASDRASAKPGATSEGYKNPGVESLEM